MSETRHCSVCGLTFNTGWGSDEQYCSGCDETTSYTPDGVTNVEEGDHVSHLHFSGVVVGIHGRTLDGMPSSVNVSVKQSSGAVEGHVTIDTQYLNPA